VSLPNILGLIYESKGPAVKQILKGGDEFDCVCNWRKKGYIKAPAGVWKRIKRRMNKRFRKEGKIQ
jgi:hypothetical protein